MKTFYSLRFLLVVVVLNISTQISLAQCPTCVPDQSCVSADGYPAICPVTPPDATAGVYYEEQITFYLPATVVDPGLGLEVTLIDVSIASVTGLPYGLQFTVNDADGVYHPSAGDNFGCATICGIPLLPGTYNLLINATALVSVFGLETTQAQSFASVLVVLPGEGSSDSFAFDNFAGCGSLDVNYQALINVPAPSVTTYSWDFGNETNSTEANPATVNYAAPGVYTAILTTTVSDYALTGVSVSNLNDNWSGDVDDLLNDADPYFIVQDANGNSVYTSSTFDNTTSATWSSPDLTLSNGPYSIQFFDADDITSDDDLGTTLIELSEGNNFFDIGNGTVGTISVSLNITTELVDSTSISVFVAPDAGITQNNNTLTLNDQSATSVTWYQNGVAINNAFGTTYTMTAGGLYNAVVSNEFGCSASSESILYCPAIGIQYDAIAQELSVADGFQSYQWSFNGLPIDGANTFYYATSDPGNYSVQITTDYGCETTSAVYILIQSIDQLIGANPSCFPNPTDDILYLKDCDITPNSGVAIFDVLGNKVQTISTIGSGKNASLNVSSLPQGVYFVMVNNRRIRWIKK